MTHSFEDYLIGPVATFTPSETQDNAARADALETSVEFLEGRIGTKSVTRMPSGMATSDLAVKALEALESQLGETLRDADAVIVVTQNPDGHGLPHTAALVCQKFGMESHCAAFDVSLGCSGYVYGLSLMRSFLAGAGLSKGVLITADPYSKVMDPDDRNTVLLFGDGAAATLISNELREGWSLAGIRMGTEPFGADFLCVKDDGVLFMNGREVFNFAAKRVPGEVNTLLSSLDLKSEDIDAFLLHQGSRYIIDALTKRLRLDPDKVPCNLDGMGNTISSSIAYLLEDAQKDANMKRLLICGFGVGFSFATAILERVSHDS